MSIITRFAPSPTGFLHIGGARTALFNWLLARHYNGKFLLRIEDTDKARSSKGAIDAIINGLIWLGINWDDDIVYQSAREQRHADIAHELVKMGKAYFCYTPQEELTELRLKAEQDKQNFKFISKWRDALPQDYPKGQKPVIRLKAPLTGEIIIEDEVQGEVIFNAKQMDDMVLLRSDGTPTYMLAVVVDDHDAQVSHIIRGDDHLNNAARQTLIYQAMNWKTPKFAHIPLIHGEDGKKLSKRHGALGIEFYQDMGYLPEAIFSYLIRLGWSHGNEEIIPREKAIKWFSLNAVGKSPARLDFKKLDNINSYYIKNSENNKLVTLIEPLIEKKINRPINKDNLLILNQAVVSLKERAKTLNELADKSEFYLHRILPDEKSQTILTNNAINISTLIDDLQALDNWQEQEIKHRIESFMHQQQLKMGDIAQLFRIAITGSTSSPSIFEIMIILGKEETMKRLQATFD